jgi:hypothetical protein
VKRRLCAVAEAIEETLRRLVRRARTAMRQPRQLCGGGIGGGSIVLPLDVLVTSGFGDGSAFRFGMRRDILAMAILTFFY